jgi:phospholipid/cholesterol/gamma-HCH transport system ATP-binding protein
MRRFRLGGGGDGSPGEPDPVSGQVPDPLASAGAGPGEPPPGAGPGGPPPGAGPGGPPAGDEPAPLRPDNRDDVILWSRDQRPMDPPQAAPTPPGGAAEPEPTPAEAEAEAEPGREPEPEPADERYEQYEPSWAGEARGDEPGESEQAADAPPWEREAAGSPTAGESGFEWQEPDPTPVQSSSSRVSVVSESGHRPPPPDGASDDEYKWHTYRVYPSGRPDAIEFIDVYKAFGRSKILRGLNMGLPEGMVSMILGPSGTGKSVCIKHMVGLLYPDAGDIVVHGESVPNMADDDLFEMRKKFGLLFQDGALFGSMNLYDNVAFPLRQHTEKGEDEVEDIVMRRLNEVGLGNSREKMPNELSGGMRKRAGFARALVLEPDIVLFDEPDSGLDPVRTALLGELILEIHRDMMEEAKEKQREHLPTFCVITHDIMSARRVADFINVLWKGRIVEAGPAEDMLGSENPFIRQFLSGESQGPLTMD